jgi:CRISPR-associated protein Cas2
MGAEPSKRYFAAEINMFIWSLKKVFLVVSYDIAEDRARRRVSKLLEDYGDRVQKSVFECGNVTEARFLKLKNRLEDEIDATTDSLRYYILCKGCIQKIEFTGTGEKFQTENFKVV